MRRACRLSTCGGRAAGGAPACAPWWDPGGARRAAARRRTGSARQTLGATAAVSARARAYFAVRGGRRGTHPEPWARG